ncbi:MAG: hypothetical protein M0Q40_11575 [Limnochordia bacterium]|nr:hypothetical protein [Limnochordia bacterium]
MIDVVNLQVMHQSFGSGIVTQQDGSYIIVTFNDVGRKRFVFPDVFKSFMTTADSTILAEIRKLITEKEERKRNRLKEIKAQKQHILVTSRPPKRTRTRRRKIPCSNIAFRCNYCDGGRSSEQVGFYGVCSDTQIRYNIDKAEYAWCSSQDSRCKQYLQGLLNRQQLESFMGEEGEGYVCYESQMLRDWRALGGTVRTGKNKGKPLRLKEVRSNSIAVLTTRSPHSEEKDRFIFAVFLVDECSKGDDRQVGYVTTNSEFRIQLSPRETPKMKFWKYYFNRSRPELTQWGSGLHRYLADLQAAQILKDLVTVKANTKDAVLAKRFFDHFCNIKGMDTAKLPEPMGALCR